MIAITKAMLITDEPITTVERDRQNKEARTEAEIGRTRFVPSRQRQRYVLIEKNVAVVVGEIMHLRNKKIVLNVVLRLNHFQRNCL